MKIYYKRIKTWHPWPFKDCVKTDRVYFSRSKKKFSKQVFMDLDPALPMTNRREAVANELNLPVKQVALVKP